MNIALKRSLQFIIVLLFSFLIATPLVSAAGGYTWSSDTTGLLDGLSIRDISSSASGKFVVAVVDGGDLYTSDNYGASDSWTNQTTGTAMSGQYWSNIAASSSGKYIAAIAGGDIYTSNNFGKADSWTNDTESTSLSGKSYENIVISASGQHITTTVYQGDVYTSNNYGASGSWTNDTNGASPGGSSHHLYGLAASSDGQYIDVADYSGDIYTNNNYGDPSSWTNDITGTSMSGGGWYGNLGVSSNGQYVYAASLGEDVYSSNNYGAHGSWTNDTTGTGQSGLSWFGGTNGGIGVSSNGQYVTIPVYNDDIDVSNNFGAGNSWSGTTTTSVLPWGIAMNKTIMSADGEYIFVLDNTGSHFFTGDNPSLKPASPTLSDISSSVSEGSTITVNVLNGVSGVDASTLVIVSGPHHGVAVDPPGTITYTPDHGYSGPDSLTFQVCSSIDDGVCSTATLSFNVTANLIPGGLASSPDTGYGQPITSNNLVGLVTISSAITTMLGIGILLMEISTPKQRLG